MQSHTKSRAKTKKCHAHWSSPTSREIVLSLFTAVQNINNPLRSAIIKLTPRILSTGLMNYEKRRFLRVSLSGSYWSLVVIDWCSWVLLLPKMDSGCQASKLVVRMWRRHSCLVIMTQRTMYSLTNSYSRIRYLFGRNPSRTKTRF